MQKLEWPTLALLAGTYLLWVVAICVLPGITLWLAVPVIALAIAQHSSLQHEALHGHPFRSQTLNTAMVFPALGLVIPYLRFRDTHLAHHRDSELTDPYDDPESNYLDGGDWDRLSWIAQTILTWNNTLLGRMALGPLIGTVVFLRSEWARAPNDPAVMRGWLWHFAMVLPVLTVVFLSPIPFWAYGVACHLALSLLRIRTYLEHQAHERVRGRSVIIEDRGPLALLFLNNNLHVVHHMHPRVPWFRLPRLFRANRARYLQINEGYAYRSYAEVFRRHALTPKDPVPHPLWRRD